MAKINMTKYNKRVNRKENAENNRKIGWFR